MIDNGTYTKVSWEYISGFFDGEGCIFHMIRQYKRSSRYCLMHISQSAKHEIESNILHDICDFLIDNGIKARIVRYPKVKENWQPAYRVIVSSTYSCRDWLNEMLPYLRVKREKAIETLEFLSSITKAWTSPRQEKRVLELRRMKLGIRKIEHQIGIPRGTVKNILIRNDFYKPFR